MADTDKPASGKDVSITVTYDGVVVKTFEVAGFDAEPQYDVVETKPLGTTQTHIDPVLVGWSGNLEIDEARKDTDELLDLLHASSEFRIPYVLGFVVTTKYRNLETKRYVYPGVKITGASKTVRRGESNKMRLQWRTGQNRIAA